MHYLFAIIFLVLLGSCGGKNHPASVGQVEDSEQPRQPGKPQVEPERLRSNLSVEELNRKLCLEDMTVSVIRQVMPNGYKIVRTLVSIKDRDETTVLCGKGRFQVYSYEDFRAYAKAGSSGNRIYCDRFGNNCEFEVVD